MNLYDAAWQLTDLLETNRAVLLRTEPEVPDFTIQSPFKIIIAGNKQTLELEVNAENITSIASQLDFTIFDKDHIDRLYTWNFKSFATYFHYVCKKYLIPTTNIIDLNVIENFLGIKKNRPENLIEAVNRAKAAIQHKGWFKLYKSIYLPLTLKVLPTIESTPLLNESAKSLQFPYYEIEGQANGRMNCLKKYQKSYIPHRIGPEDRDNLKPLGYGYRFLTADFRHCEVTVLQWLTNDPKLAELLNSGQDLHAAIYQEITSDTCDTDKKREISKSIFLPVMYGCGPASLSKQSQLPEAICKDLILRIRNKFKTSWDWMVSKQNEAKEKGEIKDYFDRPRTFTEKDCYLVRNFLVQGVAATVCQEKLIDLFGIFNNPEKSYLAYSVHDGFGIVTKVEYAREVYKDVKRVLEIESKLCAGLKMKVQIKFGAKLNAMKILWKD